MSHLTRSADPTSVYSSVETLWHAGTGYVSPARQKAYIFVEAETKTGDWVPLGTSTMVTTKNMFSAWIIHDPVNLAQPIEYSVFPTTKSKDELANKTARCTPQTVTNTDIVSTAIDSSRRTFAAAFWKAEGGAVYVPQMGLTIHVDKPVVLVVKLAETSSTGGELSVADPTHESGAVNIQIIWTTERHHRVDCIGDHCLDARHGSINPPLTTLAIDLPAGGMAGSSVTRKFSRST